MRESKNIIAKIDWILPPLFKCSVLGNLPVNTEYLICNNEGQLSSLMRITQGRGEFVKYFTTSFTVWI